MTEPETLYRLKCVGNDIVFEGVTIAPNPQGVILPAFYFSQWDVPGTIDSVKLDADDRRGDCGPASLTSIIAYLTEQYPTVDQVATACGQPTAPPGSNYTNHYQLRMGARAYGVTLESRSPANNKPFSIAEIKLRVGEGRPSIALINYGILREGLRSYPQAIQNQDSFSGAHWVCTVGYGSHPQLGKCIVINDPDYWQPRRSDGNHRYIPEPVFDVALSTVAQPNSWARQGLVVTSPTGRLP